MARTRVKVIAEMKGFNITELARVSRVSMRTVSQIWNNPARTVNTDTLQRLADALEVSIKDLFEEDEPTALPE